MGGHLDGALGAQIVIEVARDFSQNPPIPLLDDPTAALDHLCQRMHDTINRQSETARSTVVMVWLDRDRAHWLNIGDSRLYQFRRGRRLMRTRDHSAVQLLMDMGENRRIANGDSSGAEPTLPLSGRRGAPQVRQGPVCRPVRRSAGAVLDGVWEHIAETEFWTAAADHGPAAAAQLLAEQAAQRGGATADNATLVSVARGRPRWRPRALAAAAVGGPGILVRPRPLATSTASLPPAPSRPTAPINQTEAR